MWIIATTFHCPLNRLYVREHGEHKDADSVSVVVPSRIRVLYFNYFCNRVMEMLF